MHSLPGTLSKGIRGAQARLEQAMLPSCSLLSGESHPSPIPGADFGQSLPGTPVLELSSSHWH